MYFKINFYLLARWFHNHTDRTSIFRGCQNYLLFLWEGSRCSAVNIIRMISMHNAVNIINIIQCSVNICLKNVATSSFRVPVNPGSTVHRQSFVSIGNFNLLLQPTIWSEQSVTSRSREFCSFFDGTSTGKKLSRKKSTGTGPGKNWSQKKVPVPVPKKFGPEKKYRSRYR